MALDGQGSYYKKNLPFARYVERSLIHMKPLHRNPKKGDPHSPPSTKSSIAYEVYGVLSFTFEYLPASCYIQ